MGVGTKRMITTINTVIIVGSATVLVLCLTAIHMLVTMRSRVSEAEFIAERVQADASDLMEVHRMAIRAFLAYRTAVVTYPEDVSPATYDLLRLCLNTPCKKDALWDTFYELLAADVKRGVCKRVFDSEAEEPPK